MKPQRSLWRTLHGGFRLARPYFQSAEKKTAWGLFVGVITLQLCVVGIDVALNLWRAAFFEALQKKDGAEFARQLWIYCVIGAGFILATTFQAYVTQWLTIRWRRWMSEGLVARWLSGPIHYRMQVLAQGPDNPDQRIAEDVRAFVRLSLTLTVGLLGSVVSLASFVFILWELSAAAPLTLLGLSWDLPGYLVWAALAYAVVGTVFTHFVGRGLIPLDVEQERREADYRYALVRLRENGEAVALARGETRERSGLNQRFDSLVHNTFSLMRKQRNLSFFTAGYKHASLVFPYLVVGPLYFAGKMSLGVLMQTGSAFAQVRTALSYLVTSYATVAEVAAVIQRLMEFEESMAEVRSRSKKLFPSATQDGLLSVDSLSVLSPGGEKVLTQVDQLDVRMGEVLLVLGPPGAGKSSLMRAVMDIWPRTLGNGTNSFQRLAVVQRDCYVPLGSLREALLYPEVDAAISMAAVQDTLEAVDLAKLVGRLGDESIWQVDLSAGELQRFAVARSLLANPDLLWLDEAFSSLPPDEAEHLFNLLRIRLPEAAIVVLDHEKPHWMKPTSTIRLDAPGHSELLTGLT